MRTECYHTPTMGNVEAFEVAEKQRKEQITKDLLEKWLKEVNLKDEDVKAGQSPNY